MRPICVQLPSPKVPLSIVVPGAGALIAVQELSLDAYNVCNDARAFIGSFQPLIGALGLPMCLLGCVTAVTNVFTTEFPFVDPAALADLVEKCGCLANFSPLGFCSMIHGLTRAIYAVLSCMTGLLFDIIRMEAQVNRLIADPSKMWMVDCVRNNAGTLRETVKNAFGPVSALLDSTSFLFSLLGIEPISLSLAGDTSSAVLESVQAAQAAVGHLLSVIEGICPL